MNPNGPLPASPIGRLACGLSVILLGYWALFALLAPVTVWDAHVYNLGRLPLAELGGIWDNPLWTTERQLVFPLTFDAIHLPLLHLGAGFALPSFLCLLGILVVAWHVMREWHGAETAWLGVLVLLSLPTLAFQGVGTKNDIAVLFGLAVWFHAHRQWRRDPRSLHLCFAALAIGFMAGAKSSGLLPALLCSLVSAWEIRRHRAGRVRFAAAWVAAMILLGSVETYVATQRAYGHPLGREAFVRDHRNDDGLRGTVANGIRYAMGNIATGLEPWLDPDPITPWLEARCRDLLRTLNVADAGYRDDFNDERLTFARSGWDSASDFGPLGTLGLATGLLALVWWRHRETWWRLALAGLILLGGIAASVAWMPWNHRFLVAPFVLLVLATVSWAAPPQRRLLRVLLLLLSGISALAYPITSFNKRPADLVNSLVRREAQSFKERPSLQPALAAIRDWRAQNPGGEVLLVAGTDSWVLPFLSTGRLAVRPVPLRSLAAELSAKRDRRATAAVLVLNRPDFLRPDFQRAGFSLRPITRIAGEPDSALYRFSTAPTSGQPYLQWEQGRYGDGWTAPNSSLSVEDWASGGLELDCWNPTPVARTLRLASADTSAEHRFQPGERRVVRIPVASFDLVTLTVTPAIVPAEIGIAPDHRALGLHVTARE